MHTLGLVQSGTTVSLSSHLKWSLTDLYDSATGRAYDYDSEYDYYQGRLLGDAISAGLGVAETVNSVIAIAGTWACIGVGTGASAGAGAAVLVPAGVAATTALVAGVTHGAGAVTKAALSVGKNAGKMGEANYYASVAWRILVVDIAQGKYREGELNTWLDFIEKLFGYLDAIDSA